MVLDFEFCDELIEESKSKFGEVVNEIMLLHMGKIVKFILDVRVEDLASYTAIDRWVLYVTRNSVKKLSLRISNIDDHIYTLPPCLFPCSTLTHLKLTSCSFNPPASFLGFPNLVTLRLASVTFSERCVIKAPLLASLALNCCDGMQYLNIVSPVLKSLYVGYCHSYIALNCFMNCKNLRDLRLVFTEGVDNPNHDHKSTLKKLLVSLPALVVLLLDSVLIEVKGINDNVEAFLKCLKTPGFLQLPLNKLEYVSFYGFASPICVLFLAMIFLSHAPSLLRIYIEQPIHIDSSDIAIELSRLPRASPKAELVCDLIS